MYLQIIAFMVTVYTFILAIVLLNRGYSILIMNKKLRIDNVFEVNLGDNISYMSLYEVVLTSKTSVEDFEKFIRSLAMLSSKISSELAIVSTISEKSYNTYVIVISDDKDKVIQDSSIILSLATALSQTIKLTKVSTNKIKTFMAIPFLKASSSMLNKASEYHFPASIHYMFSRRKNIEIHEFLGTSTLLNRVVKEEQSTHYTIGVSINTTLSQPVYLVDDDFFKHILIAGSTGSGKTTTAKRIIYEVLRNNNNLNIIVFDWHGEYTAFVDLIHKSFKIQVRIFKPGTPTIDNIPIPLVSCDSDLELSLAILESVLELTPPQTSILINIIDYLCKDYTEISSAALSNTMDDDKVVKPSSRSEAEALSALKRKVKLLNWGQGKIMFNRINNTTIDDIVVNNYSIIDLSTIINPRLKVLYSLLLLKKLYEKKVMGNIESNLLVIIEEAYNFIKRHSVISDIILDSRKYGLGLIIVTQTIKELSREILANTNTKIFHRIADVDEAEYASKIIGKEFLQTLLSLEPGEAVIANEKYSKPLVVKIYGFDI